MRLRIFVLIEKKRLLAVELSETEVTLLFPVLLEKSFIGPTIIEKPSLKFRLSVKFPIIVSKEPSSSKIIPNITGIGIILSELKYFLS